MLGNTKLLKNAHVPEVQVGPHWAPEHSGVGVIHRLIFRPVHRPRNFVLGHWKPLHSILIVEQTTVVDFSHMSDCNERSCGVGDTRQNNFCQRETGHRCITDDLKITEFARGWGSYHSAVGSNSAVLLYITIDLWCNKIRITK